MDTEAHFSAELFDSEPMRRATMGVAQALTDAGLVPTDGDATEKWNRCRTIAQFAVCGFVLGGGFEPDAMEAVRASFKPSEPTN